jgi:hypothetical protein
MAATALIEPGPQGPPPLERGGLIVPTAELVDLCALDPELYCRTFFPHTFRQATPAFHSVIWDRLESRRYRHVALEVFRGGAKTTILRAYTSKRIAYGVSRTILLVSEAQELAKQSLRWLKKNIEHNKPWTELYGLKPGTKWTDEHIEIWHEALGISITVVALGITGQVRGLNIDDFRPDLIVVDDPCDEENTATPEQREKISELFFGALERSLVPPSESPDAKMVLLQTSLAPEDLINNCHKDPSWATQKFSCFDEEGRSRWEERFPTEFLRQEKRDYAERGQLALWLREMECTLSAMEDLDFRGDWLQYWETVPAGLVIHMAIDPVPPPSEREQATGFRKKDFEVLIVGGAVAGKFYFLEIARSRGHTPEWTVAEFFRLLDKWHPLKVRVEGIAYQRTLKWILEKEMQKRRRFVQLDVVADKRNKRRRIVQAYSGVGSQKRLYLHRGMMDFQSQFVSYPNVSHDDDLDAGAMLLDSLQEYPVEMEGQETAVNDQTPLTGWRRCP